MPRRDNTHDIVKSALEREGWLITNGSIACQDRAKIGSN